MIYNRVLENVLLPLGDLVLGTSYVSALKECREIQWYDRAQLDLLQEEKLARVLEHAVNAAPYYRRWVGSVTPTDLGAFPILTKKILRENASDLLTRDRSKLIEIKSSGSTGERSVVYMDKAERSRILAWQTLWWEWAGYRIGDSILQTGITPDRGLVKSVKDRLFRTDYVPAFSIVEETVVDRLKKLRSRRGRRYLMGYASSLYVFAKIAVQYGIDDLDLEAAVSWGDKMFAHYRRQIGDTFHTRVFDTYGCSEGLMIAGQCVEGRYHITSPHVLLEILDDRGYPVAEGELGHVVVTKLDGYAMPLIRYDVGDLAVRAPERDRCPCGRELPILQGIVGRDTDIVRTRSGKAMVVHSFTGIFEHIAEIRQFRVVQRDRDGIEVEYVPEAPLPAGLLERVRERIQTHLDEDFAVTFTQVPSIAPTPSGKPQIIQSFLERGQIGS